MYIVQHVDQKGTVEKNQKTHHTLLCEFCKSMGHDVNNCQSLQLMQDHTHDVFQVQEELRVVIVVVLREVDIKEVLEADIDATEEEDMEVVEDPPLVLIVVR
jgi:hypothetical protein